MTPTSSPRREERRAPTARNPAARARADTGEERIGLDVLDDHARAAAAVPHEPSPSATWASSI
jgi:hypothetical protein